MIVHSLIRLYNSYNAFGTVIIAQDYKISKYEDIRRPPPGNIQYLDVPDSTYVLKI